MWVDLRTVLLIGTLTLSNLFGVDEWIVDQVACDLQYWKEKGIDRGAIQRIADGDWKESWKLIYVSVDKGKLICRPLDKGLLKHPRYPILAQQLHKLSSNLILSEKLAFFITLQDCSEFTNFQELPVPILTFAKHANNTHAICMPDFEALQGYAKLRAKILGGIQNNPWNQKKELAFWRGTSTGYIQEESRRIFRLDMSNCLDFPRQKLVMMSIDYPNFIDARMTCYVDYQGQEVLKKLQAYCPSSPRVLPEDHLAYKYLVDVDGHTCSYSRMFWILASNSLLFKQMTDDIQWYYKAIIPWKHFVPFTFDNWDLIEKIEWAKSHDNQAREIAVAATHLADTVFSERSMRAYLAHLFGEYSRLIVDRSGLEGGE